MRTTLARTAARLAAVAALATSLASTAPHASAEHAADCADRSKTFAKLLQPSGGTATVNAGPAGSYTLAAGSPVPSITVSFTGQMDVVIEHACLQHLTLDVTKDGGGLVHHNEWTLSCEHATKTDSVNIGLDGGTYTFRLGGVSCDGRPLRSDGQGGVVADPPIF